MESYNFEKNKPRALSDERKLNDGANLCSAGAPIFKILILLALNQ